MDIYVGIVWVDRLIDRWINLRRLWMDIQTDNDDYIQIDMYRIVQMDRYRERKMDGWIDRQIDRSVLKEIC